ncbi:phage portal protein [Streptomyces cucumeris]|uniref:phage portal protein n=1 Tax=Streptomyces cucumeris TaxID=2962890 RepID=UPI0020C86E9C|nr:phage portal protein [Streptomyces sp. NEAU-Y11]MCP9209289.1 phage portal protein [Streptomyces sp. NEAU-Y11]
MSLFFRRREQRAPFAEPPIPRPSEAASTFASINLSRAESSLQKVAVWAAVDLQASLLSTLPLDVYRGEGAARQALPAPALLTDPSGEGFGVEDWLYQYMMSMLLRGNAYGTVAARDPMGLPTQVVLYHPDEVQGWRDTDDGLPRWRVSGREAPSAQMWHRRAYSVPGRLLGLSPVAHHALTIGLGLAATRFGVQWFEDGAHPSGLLTNEEALDQKQATTAKQRFMAALRGTREPVVLGKGWKYQQIQIAPDESQFLETQQYSSAECARIYGPGMPEILGYATGGSMTYANVEQRSLDLLTYTLDPWLTRTERMFTAMLPEGVYVKYNRAALARTDLLTRYRAHAIALRNRWTVVNEVRDIEDMGHVPWGAEPNELAGSEPDLSEK